MKIKIKRFLLGRPSLTLEMRTTTTLFDQKISEENSYGNKKSNEPFERKLHRLENTSDLVPFPPFNASFMPRTHGANKSNLFAQILNPYEVTLSEFAQINDGLFAHVYEALRMR